MQDTPINYADVQSPFIIDRIHETSWSHRQYITDLLALARCIERNGPRSYAEAFVYGNLKSRYPLEHRALVIEHQERRNVLTEEFERMKEDYHRKCAAIDAQKLRHTYEVSSEHERLMEESLASWHTVGGRS